MDWINDVSLSLLLMRTAMEVFGVSEEAATQFAQIAAARVTGFFLRFDYVPDCLILRDVKYEDGRFITEWESVSSSADCPKCGKTSERQFSLHLIDEMIQDLSINGIQLWHRIWRKQYICTNDHCYHQRFLESFPNFIEKRYSRMTSKLADHIVMVAKDTSNRAAVRILKDEGTKISKDVIGRLILRRGGKQIEENLYDNADKVVNVGIDDINFRKGDGSTSCLVTVNLDTGEILCIARGTTGEVAQNILSMFPNLKIVARDRDTAMASAAKNLGKIPVADRYHIVANMHEAIKRTLYENLPSTLHIPIGESWVTITYDDENEEIAAVTMPASLKEEDIQLRVRMAHLSPKEEKTYRDTLRILELTTLGKHAEEIAKIVDLPVEKVRSLRKGMRDEITRVEKRIDEFCANPADGVKKQKSVSAGARHSSRSIVAPYHDTVVSMRNEGCSHWVIWEAIRKLGFEGSHSTVDNYIIKLSREASIESEMKEAYDRTKDPSILIPERPERIAVSIISAKTVYERALTKISEGRPKNTEQKQEPGKVDAAVPDHDTVTLNENKPDDGIAGKAAPEKKSEGSSLIPAHNRTKTPLELARKLNWLEAEKSEVNTKAGIPGRDEAIDRYLTTMFPVYNDVIQFGSDFHNFMDNHDLEGLDEFIRKYKGSDYGKLAQFANGLQKDIEAVRNALLYPNISSGIVEGSNNSTKCTKRVGGSRMKIDFLAAKMALRTAGRKQAPA